MDTFSYEEKYYSQYGRPPMVQMVCNNDEAKTNNKLKWKGIKETVKSFLADTTAHGVPRTISADSIYKRIFWILVVSLALFFNIGHLSLLIAQYLRFPSEEITKVQFEWVEFPSVTLCNIKAMSTSQKYDVLLANETSRFSRWLKKLQLMKQYIDNNRTNFTEREFLEDNDLYERLRTPKAFFVNIGKEEAKLVGHKSQDMIISCRFNEKACSWKNFTYYQDSTFYNCYIFNGQDNEDSLVTQTTGPAKGLSLLVYLETDNNGILNGTYYKYSNVENAGGIRVAVHSPQTRPETMAKGIDLPPGYSTSAKIRVTNYERLKKPVGNCTDQTHHSKVGYRYSMDTCLGLCQQRYITDRCNCMSSTFPYPKSDKHRYCGSGINVTLIMNDYDCVNAALSRFACDDARRSRCMCNRPCTENFYSTDISYSYWPLDYYQADFFNTYVRQNPNRDKLKAYSNLGYLTDAELISGGYIRRNFLRFNLFMEDLSIEKREEKQGYELQNLFSDIGGTLGLWIGVSIITIIEIIELLVRVAMKAFGKVYDKKTTEADQQAEMLHKGNPKVKNTAWHIKVNNNT